MEHLEKDTVVLDKDDTVMNHECRIFPGVREFLERQRAQNRRLVMATMAGERVSKEQMREFDGLFDEFFGLERLREADVYIRPDGSIQRLYERFQWSYDLCQLDKNFRKLLIWLFDREAKLYQNPYRIQRGKSKRFLKDLYLLRRHLSATQFEQLRMVLVGDIIDLLTTPSDPETPFILVPADGKWLNRGSVDKLLDKLFSDPKNPPGAVFDALLEGGKTQLPGHEWFSRPSRDSRYGLVFELRTIRKALAEIENEPFVLSKSHDGCRIILESPVI